MDIARGVRGVDAHQPRERTGIDAVLVLRDQPQPDLDRYRAEQGQDAERSQRRVPDPAPASAEIGKHGPWTPHEVTKTRGRAADEAPEQPEDEQSQDRAAGPNVPVGMVVVDRPPTEGDQPGE